jgi:hypothetical protein
LARVIDLQRHVLDLEALLEHFLERAAHTWQQPLGATSTCAVRSGWPGAGR